MPRQRLKPPTHGRTGGRVRGPRALSQACSQHVDAHELGLSVALSLREYFTQAWYAPLLRKWVLRVE